MLHKIIQKLYKYTNDCILLYLYARSKISCKRKFTKQINGRRKTKRHVSSPSKESKLKHTLMSLFLFLFQISFVYKKWLLIVSFFFC